MNIMNKNHNFHPLQSVQKQGLHISDFIDASKPATLTPLEALAGDEDDAKGYVFIHCWFNTVPEDNAEGTIRLLYKDARKLDPRNMIF